MFIQSSVKDEVDHQPRKRFRDFMSPYNGSPLCTNRQPRSRICGRLWLLPWHVHALASQGMSFSVPRTEVKASTQPQSDASSTHPRLHFRPGSIVEKRRRWRTAWSQSLQGNPSDRASRPRHLSYVSLNIGCPPTKPHLDSSDATFRTRSLLEEAACATDSLHLGTGSMVCVLLESKRKDISRHEFCHITLP